MTNFIKDCFYQLRSMIDTSENLIDTEKLNMRKCLNDIENEFVSYDKKISSAYDKESVLKDILEHIIDNL